MEAIEGVDLAKEVIFAEESVIGEKRDKVRAAVRGIIKDVEQWQQELLETNKKARELETKIAGAKVKYDKLKSGDWGVFNENMLKGRPSSEKP